MFLLRGVKFVVRKFAGRWSFGTADQSFVTFDSKERAIEHAREIIRRIPGTELVIVERPPEPSFESRMFSPQCDVLGQAR